MSSKPKTAKIKKPARGGLAAQKAAMEGSATTKTKRAKKLVTETGDKGPSAKAYIEEFCNAGQTTKKEAVELVVAKYGVTEKAAKGAVNNCRHYQHKEGRPQGEWKKEVKPEKEPAKA